MKTLLKVLTFVQKRKDFIITSGKTKSLRFVNKKLLELIPSKKREEILQEKTIHHRH